jgi:hypothetical protein
MIGPRFRTATLVLTGALGLSACAYGDGYGYGGISAGYGNAGYGRSGYCDPNFEDCYGYGGYGGYGTGYAGYGDPWYGWYGDYYYPGVGFYVYDSGGRRHRWSDNDRRYWESRRGTYQGRNWNDQRWQRWDGYRNRDSATTGNRGDRNWQRDRTTSDRNWQQRQGTTGDRSWQQQRSEGTQSQERRVMRQQQRAIRNIERTRTPR